MLLLVAIFLISSSRKFKNKKKVEVDFNFDKNYSFCDIFLVFPIYIFPSLVLLHYIYKEMVNKSDWILRMKIASSERWIPVHAPCLPLSFLSLAGWLSLSGGEGAQN